MITKMDSRTKTESEKFPVMVDLTSRDVGGSIAKMRMTLSLAVASLAEEKNLFPFFHRCYYSLLLYVRV